MLDNVEVATDMIFYNFDQIDWVRPGYLGEISSFTNRYKNPIEHVYSDSTPSEVKVGDLE